MRLIVAVPWLCGTAETALGADQASFELAWNCASVSTENVGVLVCFVRCFYCLGHKVGIMCVFRL